MSEKILDTSDSSSENSIFHQLVELGYKPYLPSVKQLENLTKDRANIAHNLQKSLEELGFELQTQYSVGVNHEFTDPIGRNISVCEKSCIFSKVEWEQKQGKIITLVLFQYEQIYINNIPQEEEFGVKSSDTSKLIIVFNDDAAKEWNVAKQEFHYINLDYSNIINHYQDKKTNFLDSRIEKLKQTVEPKIQKEDETKDELEIETILKPKNWWQRVFNRK